jgi:RNA polymerase sigma-70 factor (ECF subfamily)
MMEITIKINGRLVSVEVSADVADYLEQAKRNNRKLYREHQRYWDGREYDEYIIATEGRLPYYESPEQYVCRMETRREILTVLALCTEKQRERFLLHALYDFSYEEVGKICGCSKYAVRDSIEAVRKIFLNFFKNRPHD